MNNNELKIIVPNGWVVNEKAIPNGDRVVMVTRDDDTTFRPRESIFREVPASQLSLKDDFMNYTPKTEIEKKFKREVKKVIKVGINDFWCPICSPSIDDSGRIFYMKCLLPCRVRRSYSWWVEKAQSFCPEHGSRLGSKSEYIAFLATLIKDLVASGKSIEWAWNAVCNDYRKLGYDRSLINTSMILAKDNGTSGFWLVGNEFTYNSFKDIYSLADFYHDVFCHYGGWGYGWIVFDSCPDC